MAHPLLARWGFGRLLESLYGRVVKELSGKSEAICRGYVADLLCDRGEYDAAIAEYQELAGVFKRLGDMMNVSLVNDGPVTLIVESRK